MSDPTPAAAGSPESSQTPGSPVPQPVASAPAGWYADPQAPGQQRYWDGTGWMATAPVATAPTTSTNAIVGLVLAILSWPLCPIIAAIPALILARVSDKEIDASGGTVGGAGLNTATRIIAWVNIAVYTVGGIVLAVLVALGLIFTSVNPFILDPTINARTGLADGSYVMESVGVRVNLVGECTYGDMASTLDGVDVKEVTVYGTGPTQCPDIVEVGAVYFDVVDGVAEITRVE